MKTYSIKEVYYTIQGEGMQTGRPAVFCRFSGCNLWSGREEDRDNAICQFCDTQFVGTDGENGGKYPADQLVQQINRLWPDAHTAPYVVCTGGEPLLQLDTTLVTALKNAGIKIAIETNGTISAPSGIDWICVSPKAGTDLIQTSGHELKLVFPQEGILPEQFEHLDFEYFFLQPMDGPSLDQNIKQSIAYCLTHPNWRLSLQTHKYSGMK
ncbi:MAG: 7-carboxy-7-deazaguanine synthase [Saprospiraceae bacterium]|nr:7-carboxy-7-deazaguanine synthase [Saprospiraceae bacterium]